MELIDIKTTKVQTASDHNLYAKWQANTYTITLDKQSGSDGTTSITATYDSNLPNITIPTKKYIVTLDANSGTVSPTSIEANNTFGGYYSSTNGGGTQYINNTGNSVRTWNSTTINKLYAKWTSASVTLPTPSRSGYTFLGWFNPSGTQVSTTYTPTSNITLTAHWQLDEVTVTVNSALSDTITFTGPTSGTIYTNGNGIATGVKLQIGTYTFTSSVAYSTSSTSSKYSKSVTITSSTSVVNVYPNGAIYWYGNGYGSSTSLYSVTNGFSSTSSRPSGATNYNGSSMGIYNKTHYIEFSLGSQTNKGYGGTVFVSKAVSMSGYSRIKTLTDNSLTYNYSAPYEPIWCSECSEAQNDNGCTMRVFATTSTSNGYNSSYYASRTVNSGKVYSTISSAPSSTYIGFFIGVTYYWDSYARKSKYVDGLTDVYAIWRE